MEMLQSYLEQIKKIPLLDAKMESKLAQEIQKGNKESQTKLIQSNLRLVVSIAKKIHANSNISIMDLIQEGNMGLMMAASKFSHKFNTRFSTYAYPWILQYILRYAYSKTSMISLPHRKEELIRKITQAKDAFYSKFNREPTAHEISDFIGCPLKDVFEVFSYTFSVCSLDLTTNEEGSSTLGDIVSDNRYNPEEEFINKEQKSEILNLIGKLPPKEREVIFSRFNFSYLTHIPTLRELSSRLEVSAETIRQIEIRALKKLSEDSDFEQFKIA